MNSLIIAKRKIVSTYYVYHNASKPMDFEKLYTDYAKNLWTLILINFQVIWIYRKIVSFD